MIRTCILSKSAASLAHRHASMMHKQMLEVLRDHLVSNGWLFDLINSSIRERYGIF